ncbi:eIF2A-related protein [Paraburkholderia hospita]|uniref:nSTAND1 domain-containing NTPase n=1 Tax=Paraburkholderia hospita TaxID=169430 RepID=UPI000B34944A|nr:TIR domain-containing protein [Paraburkholderia hospita]OUL72725.1 hypothetical protein CA603_45175 [Paraburkholderia hospita]
MSRIFISHSSANNASALAIGRWLVDNGWEDYFLDLEPAKGLNPGQRWQEALKTAANRCEAVLFLVSPAWRDSHWCIAEFIFAKSLGKTVFGVVIEEVSLESLPKEITAEWQLCDLVAGAQRKQYRVSHDPLVPETDVSFAESGLSLLRLGLRRSGLDPSWFPWPPPLEPERAPYPGLRALGAEDAAVFFGREAAVIRALDMLRQVRDRGIESVVIILGASGAGKSSFLCAGLWPRLKRDDRNFLPLPVIRPERSVLNGATGLAASFDKAFRELGAPRTRAGLRQSLETRAGFERLLAEFQTLHCSRLWADAATPTILICVDQGEELFNAEGREEAAHFLSLLAQILTPAETGNIASIDKQPRALAFVAIRTDSYEQLQTAPELRGISPQLFSLPPMEPAEFKWVIEGPATRATAAGHKLSFQPALTERLLRDAEGVDALPLLAFTLERLYIDYGGAGTIRLEDYESIGGVRGSIEAAVVSAFADPGREPTIPANKAERERLLLEGFIPWLARVDPQTDERKRRLARWDELPVAAHSIMERLIEQRLLQRDRRNVESSSGPVTVVEIAHEALLRQWPTLITWLDADADALKTLDIVRRAADEWHKNACGQAWLVHTGERLTRAEALLQRPDFERLLGELSGGYLRACRERDEVIRAEREKQIAIRAELPQARAAQALNELEYSPERAMLMALAALHVNATTPSGMVMRACYSVFDKACILYTYRRHADRISSVGWRPDGRLIATGSYDGTARIWMISSDEETTLRGHSDSVTSVAWSPDGRHILTGSWDNTAIVWDAETASIVTSLKGHSGWVSSVSWSPDGRFAATGSADSTARIWNVETGETEQVLKGHTAWVRSAEWSPDGQRILTGSYDNTARLFDVKTGKSLRKLTGHTKAVPCVDWSPDGKWALTASEDGTVRVWDSAKWKASRMLEVHTSPVYVGKWSPDGKRILTGSEDGKVRVWDSASGTRETTLSGHTGWVSSVGWSPDGTKVVSGSVDRTARVWDACSRNAVKKVTGWIDRAIWGSDGKHVLACEGGQTIHVWDLETGDEAYSFTTENVTAVAWSSDQRYIVLGHHDGLIDIREPATDRTVVTLTGHTDMVSCVALSPDQRQLLSTSRDGTARIWKLETKAEPDVLRHGPWVQSGAWSPDGTMVATACWDNSCKLWRSGSATEGRSLTGHNAALHSVAWSPDSQQVITSSGDGTLRIWNAATESELFVMHAGEVNSVAWSPDGSLVLSGGQDGSVRTWDAATGTLVRILNHAGAVFSVAWNPDGSQILTSGEDGTLRVWVAQRSLVIAEITRKVCRFFSDEDIKKEIPTWRNCDVETAQVADDVRADDLLRVKYLD